MARWSSSFSAMVELRHLLTKVSVLHVLVGVVCKEWFCTWIHDVLFAIIFTISQTVCDELQFQQSASILSSRSYRQFRNITVNVAMKFKLFPNKIKFQILAFETLYLSECSFSNWTANNFLFDRNLSFIRIFYDACFG